MLKKLLLTIAVIGACGGCAAPAPTKEDRDDVERLISAIEPGGACSVGGTIDKVDDELFVRLIGGAVLKQGVPKVTSPKQAEFYRLALESKKIPTGKDKEALLSIYSLEGKDKCFAEALAFNNKDIRTSMVDWFNRSTKTIQEIKNNKLTYEQILDGMSQGDMSGKVSQLAAAFQQEPTYMPRIQMAMYPFLKKMKNVFDRYEIDPDSIK